MPIVILKSVCVKRSIREMRMRDGERERRVWEEERSFGKRAGVRERLRSERRKRCHSSNNKSIHNGRANFLYKIAPQNLIYLVC